jgi:biopolymer transport protein TolR
MNNPHINVTPLIDVLLVLLIIFMVVTPLKPSSFKARVPFESQINDHATPNPDILVVSVGVDSLLKLNAETIVGSIADTSALTKRLNDIFIQRVASGNVSQSFADGPNRPANDRIERTVFIKAPSHLDYGSVARVVDAVKLGGAYPISLQIDDLE